MPRNLWGPPEWHWRHMPVASLGAGAGITPVQNTWYTVLDTVKNVKVKSIWSTQTNDEAAAKNGEIRVTCDGVSSTVSAAWPNNGARHWSISPTSDAVYLVNTPFMAAGSYCRSSAKSIKIEFRTTSVVGTNPLLFASVQYEQLERIKIT